MGELHDRPSAAELVGAVREFLERDVFPALEGRVQFHTRVAMNALAMVERELTLGPEQAAAHAAGLARLGVADETELAGAIRGGGLDDRLPDVLDVVRATVRAKLEVANPKYLGPAEPDVPLANLGPAEKARRAGSFGSVASHYQRYRPGPPAAAVDWLLPSRVGCVVDLGAGTGALTRLLVDRADDVVAVEPDDRMRAVLTEQVPGVRAVNGRGDSMPLPDGCADAVLASSSWHWMDPVPTLHEVARVLAPGGVLGAIWSGPDPEGPFLVRAQAVLAETARAGGPERAAGGGGAGAGREALGLVMADARRPPSRLEIPPDVPFSGPEHEVLTWVAALTADDLIGLLGTLSWIITMQDEPRRWLLAEARRLLREALGVEGDVTVDVDFRADAWRSRRHG